MQLRPHYETIRALKTDIVVISFSSSVLGRAWLSETDVPFRLLLDPERRAYRAYGLRRSRLRSWSPKIWLHYLRLFRQGYRWRGIQGDSGQLGADFIVDRQGIIRLAHRSRDPADRPTASALLEAVQRLM